MKVLKLNELKEDELKKLFCRSAINFNMTFDVVRSILDDVKNNGLQAAKKYAAKFDGFKDDTLGITKDEFNNGENLPKDVKYAIDLAYKNIKTFHEQQLGRDYDVETMPGVKCSRKFVAIENVGLYIPGGTAVLPSTMLMLGIPAKLAGCKRVVACTPVKGSIINPAVLYAASLCGIQEIYKLGGAQAIALLAYGDKNIPKVDKIFGPGNQFVTAAKTLVSIDPDGCTIDMPAGPSEVLIIADENADPKFVAADLLSQAEHGSDSQSILVTISESIANSVVKELKGQLNLLARKDIAEGALKNSFVLITSNVDEAISFSNKYAPEHLIINTENSQRIADKVTNAGSVFLGAYSPESVGDYTSGTNHSLPTYGYAKSIGGVSVDSFMKGITFQELTKTGLKNLADATIKIAETENLQAHANAVKIRLEEND